MYVYIATYKGDVSASSKFSRWKCMLYTVYCRITCILNPNKNYNIQYHVIYCHGNWVQKKIYSVNSALCWRKPSIIWVIVEYSIAWHVTVYYCSGANQCATWHMHYSGTDKHSVSYYEHEASRLLRIREYFPVIFGEGANHR